MSGFIGGRRVPPAVILLGYELESADATLGEVTVRFHARPEFANLMGFVQGGFVAAMLDSTGSSAVLTQLEDDQVVPTLEMKTSYLRPTPLGLLRGRGRVVHRSSTIAFLESRLYDPDDVLLASATATAAIRRLRT